ALAPRGRFIEMGVADIRSEEAVANLRSDISYHPFNLAPALATREKFVREILDDVFAQFASGNFQPLPRKLFSMEAARDGFRYMAQARHIGRVVLQPLAEARAGIRNDGAYLVTGGMSGIGLTVSEWLARHGAAQVIVMGRHAPDTQAAEIFDNMQNAGTIVSVHRGDVANESDVKAALAEAKDVPLRGIFHCAGVLDDGALLQQDWMRFERVLAPKLTGAFHLHRMTADRPLDHFVLFSSIASIFGSPGQTNYAAANAALDALAQQRRAEGLPGVSINWGAWSETGAAARLRVIERGSKTGIGAIPTEQGLRALEMLLGDTRPQMMVAPIDWKAFFQGVGAIPSLLKDLHAGRTANFRAAAVQKQQQPAWLPQLQSAAPARRQDLLLRLLTDRVQATLGLSSTQEIDPVQPLQELGLDSLLSIELRNALGVCLDRSLPATLLFNYPTLNTLAGFILREIGVDAAANTIAESPMISSPTDLLENIEALSDEEINRMLSSRTTGSAK
ncbi:MAG: SDR family NAD(P)-dependent oxidoreductase, partial [Acidobacteriaceae bacterium]